MKVNVKKLKETQKEEMKKNEMKMKEKEKSVVKRKGR
jgi:hypothetical protein